MLAGDWLRLAERTLPEAASPAALCGPRGGVLVLAPHPDDESLGCGGLVAACAAAGHPVRVTVVSDGAGSHPGSREYPPARLAALRREEVRAAVAALGLDPARDLDLLGLPDGGVPAGGVEFDAAVAAILARLPAPPAAVVATWRHDPHPDHVATAALAMALARALPAGSRLFGYPVWGWGFAYAVPGYPLPAPPALTRPPAGMRLAIGPHLPAKRRAVAAHGSQVTPLIADAPGGVRVPAELRALLDRPFELLLEEPVSA